MKVLLPPYSEIFAYVVQLPALKPQLPLFIAVLSEDEKIRMRSFYNEALQANFVLARGVLRFILAAHLKTLPQDLALDYTALGKPFIPGSRLQFNMSHTHDYCLLGLSREDPIGADIERFEGSHKACFDIAKRFFTKNEYEALCSSPHSTHQELFYHIWTQKEAFLKAIGAGLSFGLNQFQVAPHLLESHISHIQAPEYAGRTWQSLSFSKPAGYRITLTKENQLNQVHWLDFQTIFPRRNIG